MLNRREMLAGAAAQLTAGLGAARASAAAAAANATAAAGEACTTTEVAPGIHIRHGVHEEATAGNADAIANIGFVVGRDSVAVIDPGGSGRDGEALRTRLRSVTTLPISHLVLTHLHPDHVFGATAFAADRPVVVAHANMLPMLKTRGDFYKGQLAEILGPAAAGDYPAPTLLVADRATIDLGARVLDLWAHRTAHTDNDLSLFDRSSATLLAGDLLFVDRVPALDGSLKGWLAVLEDLKRLPAARAVPGHGPNAVPWPAGAADQARYLTGLEREIRALLAAGGGIEDAVAKVGLGERDKWALFDDYHGRNVTIAFQELEWE